MAKHTNTDRPSRRAAKAPQPRTHEAHEARVTHPSNLEELEEAAQTDVDPEADERGGEPMDEAHPGMAFSEDERHPAHEAGLSVDPDDLGRSWLMDAMEQDNDESEMPDREPMGAGPSLGDMISESTLETAGQEDREMPGSNALGHDADADERGEPFSEDVDLLSNAIREASLFDQPTERGGTRAPRIDSDETEPSPEHPEDREREEAETREHLRFHRDGGALRTEPKPAGGNRATPPRGKGRGGSKVGRAPRH